LANGYEARPTTIANNFKPDLWTWTGLPETGGADPYQVAQETWRIQANLSTPPSLNIRYPGQYYDFEAGLVQNWWRTYEPRIGRYSSADPIGLNGGWNRFGYAYQDGVNQYDPYGLWTVQIGFSVTGSWIPTVFGLGPTGSVGVGVAFDGNGNIGGYRTAGGGGALGTNGAVAGIQGVWSNGDTICDLGGYSTNLGLNAGFEFGGTVDTFGGSGTRNQPVGGLGITLGGGLGLQGYTSKNYTRITRFGGSECTCK
jgi:RHS repeat-associated protein